MPSPLSCLQPLRLLLGGETLLTCRLVNLKSSFLYPNLGRAVGCGLWGNSLAHR